MAGELGVPLTAHAERTEIGGEMDGVRGWRMRAVALAERGEMRLLAGALRRIDQHREIGGALRCGQRRVRAGVRLVGELEALGMILREVHGRPQDALQSR